MFHKWIALFSIYAMSGLTVGCASSQDNGNRRPAGYSRAGRAYKEPRAMNGRRMDTDAIFEACLRERSELYCRNRMGR